MKILVVHREVAVAHQVKSILHASETVVRYFNSGLDALLAGRVEKFDFIICGTDLPVITGFELIRSLRLNSINTIVPVVFIADEVNTKSEHLVNVLGGARMLARGVVEYELAPLMNATADSWRSLGEKRQKI